MAKARSDKTVTVKATIGRWEQLLRASEGDEAALTDQRTEELLEEIEQQLVRAGWANRT